MCKPFPCWMQINKRNIVFSALLTVTKPVGIINTNDNIIGEKIW